MNYRFLKCFVGVALVALLYWPSPVLAATAPSLGKADSFAVLGGSTVTNTGSSVITGDLGLWPGNSITGFPPGVLNGVKHRADAVAKSAQGDVTAAYLTLKNTACDFNLTGQDLGGKTLIPGTYCFSSSAQLTGKLTLNAQGNGDAVFVFQMGSTLTTASNSSVVMINGGQECNVFWQVGSSATLGTTTDFLGNILALTSITMNTGADLNGRALARNGAVTLDDNNVAAAQCSGGGGGGGVGGGCPDGPGIWISERIIGPPQQIIAGVKDANSGLKTITLVSVENATVSIPAFKVGTKLKVLVTMTKINQSLNADFRIRATNVAGDSCVRDPIITILKIPPFAGNMRQTFVKIPRAESFVSIVNGNLGLKSLQIRVNGVKHGTFLLEANQKKNINVSSLMGPGENTIILWGFGDPNAKALVVIADIGGSLPDATSEMTMDWQAGRPDENLVWGNQVVE